MTASKCQLHSHKGHGLYPRTYRERRALCVTFTDGWSAAQKQDMPFAFSDSLQAFQPFTLCKASYFRSHSVFPILAGFAFKVHLNLSVRLSCGALPCATQGCRNSRNQGLEGRARQGLNNRAAVGTALGNAAAFTDRTPPHQWVWTPQTPRWCMLEATCAHTCGHCRTHGKCWKIPSPFCIEDKPRSIRLNTATQRPAQGTGCRACLRGLAGHEQGKPFSTAATLLPAAGAATPWGQKHCAPQWSWSRQARRSAQRCSFLTVGTCPAHHTGQLGFIHAASARRGRARLLLPQKGQYWRQAEPEPSSAPCFSGDEPCALALPHSQEEKLNPGRADGKTRH